MNQKTRKKLHKIVAVLLAMLMVMSSFAMSALAAPVLEAPTGYIEEVAVAASERTRELTSQYMESVMLEEEAEVLLSTLQTPVGMVGFEGPYCIDGYTNETVGITVMFRTPPAVALRLIEEAVNPRARILGRNADQLYVGEALSAHDAFANQLGRLPVPFASEGIEFVGSHYMLFNGVFMNVPASMIPSIAELPEVFAVTPSFVYFTMDELANMSEEQWASRERLPVVYEATPAGALAGVYVEVEQGASEVLSIPVDAPAGAFVLSNWNNGNGYVTLDYPSLLTTADLLVVTVNAFCAEGYDAPVGQYEVAMAVVFFEGASLVTIEFTITIEVVEPYVAGPYVPHPEFNLGAIELFNIEYIRETMGLTGRGVRVGVLDSGVDYRHPVFAPYLIPSHRYTTGLGYYTLPGGNFVTQAGRQTGRDASPMEGLAGATSNHGTHVAGTIVALAPDIQLYAWRTLASTGGGTQPANSVLLAVEHAYYLELDLINLSLGNRWNTPWQPLSYALNLAALAGMVSTNSAGNDGDGGNPRAAGRGGWYSLGGGPATAVFGISVGAGQAGGRHIPGAIGSSINSTPAEIFLIGPSGPNWTYVDLDGYYDYVWFGRIELPAGGRGGTGYPAFIATVRNELFDGEQRPLEGKVAVINRGGGEFVTMQAMAEDLGAIAVVVINNQLDNSHLAGTVLNSPNQTIDAFSIRHFVGYELIGPIPPGAVGVVPPAQVVLGHGVLNFGELTTITTPDIMAGFSSIGPLGPMDNANHEPTMHLLPHIIGPGVGILSANNIQHATRIDGRPYVLMGGTSMSAPAVAGIVALMIEHLPNANPLEIRSRIMSTARPLEDYAGQYSVLQVGAGFIDPIRALTTPHFITTHHATPFAGAAWVPGSDVVLGPEGWSYQTMSSLSFGRVSGEAYEPLQTDRITVTVAGGFPSGTWDISYELIMPTPVFNPPDGNWANWGPRLDQTVTDVTVEIQRLSGVSFSVYMTHSGNPDNRGFAQGYLTLTQGDIVLTTPFGTYFDVALIPVPLEPNPYSVIWRPILSSWVTTRYNEGEADPRAFSIVHPGAGWFFPDDVGIMSRSNYSAMDFGFIDPNDGPPRPIRFYFAPYGYGIEDATLFSTGAPLASGALTTYINPVRTIKGGSSWHVNQAAGLIGVFGNATILEPGVYNLFVRVVHGAGEDYDLVQAFPFVVVDERPTIELAYETFYFEEGDDYVVVSGSVYSRGHELALAYDMQMRVASTVLADFDYTRVQLQLTTSAGVFVVPVNADGTFSFVLDAEEAEYRLRVIDGVGLTILPTMIGTIQIGWNWNAPSSNMLSYFYDFDVALAEDDDPTVFSWNIFNNGPGGTQYPRPNAGLAAMGVIRMWTLLDGVGAPIYLAATDTIVALDQSGDCAEDFLRIGRVWQPGIGWADYFNMIDVNKDGGSWHYINMSITVYGQTVEVLLVNALYTPGSAYDCDYCDDAGCEICDPPAAATFYLSTNAVSVSTIARHVSVFFSGTAEGEVTLNLLDDAPELVLQVRDNLWTPTGNVEGLVVGVAGGVTISEGRTVTLEVIRQGITELLSIELIP